MKNEYKNSAIERLSLPLMKTNVIVCLDSFKKAIRSLSIVINYCYIEVHICDLDWFDFEM